MPEVHVNDIDRELAALLAVEPSAEFAAGVRGRIAARSGSHGWPTWALAAAAALVIAGGGAAVLRPGTFGGAPAVERPSSRDVVLHFDQQPVVAVPAPVRHRSPARRIARASTEPAVVVDPAFREAVQRMLRAAQKGSANAALVVPAAPTADLAVVPMVIDDLPVQVIKLGEPHPGARQ